MRPYPAVALLLLGGCAQIVPQDPGTPPHPEVPAAIVVDGVPAVPAEVFAELRRYQNTRTARLLGWMDGGILIATRFGNTTQLHHVAQPLGMRAQITFFEEPVSAAGVNPGARDGFVYLKDSGGTEFYQLFFFDNGSGQSSRLSDGKSRYIGVSWSPSGRHVGYSTTEGNGVDWDLHTQDLAGERRVVQQGEGVGWRIDDWSHDETRLLISRYISVNESRIYEFDLGTGARRRLLGDVRAAFGTVRYGAGDDVYFTSDMGSEFRRLHRLDLVTGALSVLTADTPWDVATFAVSRDKARLAYVVNENGLSRLYAFETGDRRFTALPEIPAGIVSGLRFDPHADRVGFTVSSATTPSDVFSVDFASRQLTRWTMSEIGGLRREQLAQPSLIAYESFDGRPIPAFVYKPAQGGPHPVIVNIHGGPEGQARPGFSPSTQFYLNELGAAVIFPNVRGSAGYGKSYLKLDNGRAREDSVRDIGALLDWIAEQPDLDADRVAVMGGSYGGYMVLASLVHFGDRLQAGVERVGISNFVTFLENTQPYRQDLRRAEYGDERDPDMRAFLESISPLNHVAEIDTPLLISQGLNDPRVPASESEQIVAALQARGVPVWYVLAKNEGHGFSRKANRDYLTGVTAQFLKTRLLANE
ncbi:MAG: S9 family peptidase [Gammaproteobacteria bacterium]|nr:S9 family peptidase [Gammaproteobacteria bacterium]